MSPSSQRRIVLVLLACLLLAGPGIQPAQANRSSTFTVNYDADVNDFVLNSVCSIGTPTGGLCTLRAAIAEANAIATSMDVTINIPAGTYSLTIPPEGMNDITSGDLDLPVANPNYTIYLIGTSVQPAIIDAQQLDRVFDFGMGANIQMENIVIRGGLLSWTGTTDFADGAGILNYGNLLLTEVVIESNEARCGQATCEFYISGGGILNLGTMVILDSTIRNNKSVASSAIAHSGSGRLLIKNSTIYGNQASEAFVIDSYAPLHIRNSTISGNTAGPMYFVGIRNNHTLILESSTIANAGTLSSIYNGGGATVTIHDSILKNTPAGGGGGNCQNSGTWISEGYNIYSDDTCPATGTGDVINTDPMLGTLGAWGGPTLTMPLLEGSPAEDHRPGTCTNIPESPVLPPVALTEDQRHFGRTDGECDTGAFEGVMDIRYIFLPIIFR